MKCDDKRKEGCKELVNDLLNHSEKLVGRENDDKMEEVRIFVN